MSRYISSDVYQTPSRRLFSEFLFPLCVLLKVAFYETMLLHRPGVLPRQKLLRANKSFRGKERRDHVLVDAAGEEWIAVLIMFVKCVFDGKERKCAFIRWFEKFGQVDAATGCRLVKPQSMRSPFAAGRMVLLCLISMCTHMQQLS